MHAGHTGRLGEKSCRGTLYVVVHVSALLIDLFGNECHLLSPLFDGQRLTVWPLGCLPNAPEGEQMWLVISDTFHMLAAFCVYPRHL
jgi:hypothetical protein